MRIYSVASVAVALGVAAAQTSKTTSISTTPSTSPVSTSSGSSNSLAARAGSVSCVFRYSMPTATNLPSGVFTTTTSSTTTTSPDTDSKDEKDASGGSENGPSDKLKSSSPTPEKDTPQSGPKEKDTTQSGSKEKDAKQNASKEKDTTQSVSTSVSKDKDTTQSVSKEKDTPQSVSKDKDTTQSVSKEKDTPQSVSKEKDPAQSVSKEKKDATQSVPKTDDPSTTSTNKPPVSTTKPPVSTSDGSASNAISNTSLSSSSNEGRRLMDEVGETTVSSDASGSTEPTTSPATSATPTSSSTTKTLSSTPNSPLSTTNTPSSTSKTPLTDASGSTEPATSPATSATPTSSSTTKTPSSTTKTPASKALNSTVATPTTIPAMQTDLPSTSKTADTMGLSKTSRSTAIEFSCDSTFYSAWAMMGLTCEGTELDIASAVASTECSIYSGTSSGTDILDLATCMSICRFPACNNGMWDYSSDDGINSAIYANLDFIKLMSFAGSQAAKAAADSVQQPFSNLTFAATLECDYTSDSSFSSCQCASAMSSTPSSSAASPALSSKLRYAVPFNKGLEDSRHWPDGTKKSTVDKAGIASTSIGSGAATVSVVAGGVMSVASGIVGGTSAGVASGVSAAASVGITMAAVDICQFSIMLTQMNVDARPRFMENMGKKMAPAAFTFLPFGKSSSTSSDDLSSTSSGLTTATSRRLVTGSSSSGSSSGADSKTAGVQGMEKYASLIGVDPDMLFYLAVAGIACMVGIVFGLYVIAMGICYFIVKDFSTFSCKWLDKAIGVLMMILILSEYVVGATAMYQICYCLDHDSLDVSFFLAIVALLGLAFGTILYGVLVIKNNEDELRDLGTKDHFDKKFHNRYGPLYDEHSFEGRFFFAPKLLLALLCGMTTGMVWIQGLWQIVVLIALHIAFLLYLEVKQPYPTAFVQKTSSFVIIIKISALFLSFFLLSSATSFTESIPDDLREGVAFAIVGLQMLVLVCLMIRQVYIFYRTWKLKRDGASKDNKTVTVQTTNAREGSEAFFALGGGEPQYYSNNTNQSRGNSLAMLGDDSRKMQGHYAQETPSNVDYNFDARSRGFQPQQGSTYDTQHNNYHRNNAVDL